MASEIEDLLGSDHAELDSLLLQTFEALEAGDVPSAYHKLDLFWARLAMHIRGEHLHLFPALLELSRNPGTANLSGENIAGIQELVEELHNDHDFFMRQLLSAIKTMRAAQNRTADNIDGNLQECRELLRAVRDRLAAHNAIEEREAYPMAARFLISQDQKQLVEQLAKEITNLPPRHR